jgi:hypothetical protein
VQESCSVKALQSILRERDASILELQHEAGVERTKLKEEKRQCRCFIPATYQGEYPRYMNVASSRSVNRRRDTRHTI